VEVSETSDTQIVTPSSPKIGMVAALTLLLSSAAAFSPGLAPSSRSVVTRSNVPRMDMERTYIMIKPDGVQRGLVGEIVKRFENRGYKLGGMKLYQASEELLRQHYSDLVDKKFFPDLLSYMLSGPVTCMIWEGENAVKMGRQMLGETNPQASLPGTIRGDFSIVVGRNICHGSDSPENAEKEIKLWFDEDEIVSWESHSKDWIYE
jgi:nucleoside-diphosphate kinase